MRKQILFLMAMFYMCAQSLIAQYCSPNFANGCFGWNTKTVVLGSINWSLGSTTCATSDYTALSTSVTPGQSLPMTVSNGAWCGAGVWVDFNSDFAFDDAENLYHSYQPSSLQTYNFSITIPSNTASGVYRMRVIAGWGTDCFDNTSTNGFGACGSYQYGSFQDFSIEVISTADIQVDTAQVCAGSCVVVSDNSVGNPTAWSWSFPGANQTTSTDQNPGEVCYDEPGTYEITLITTGASGTSTATETIEVTACAIPGCMYPNASNYNPNATVDNLSCQFPCDANSCPADLDSNGIIGVSDLLIFISMFGYTCPN